MHKKYPAVVFIIPLMAGVLTGFFSGLNLSFLPLWSVLTVQCLLFAAVILLYKPSHSKVSFLFVYLFLICSYGFISFQYQYSYAEADSITRTLDEFKGRNVRIKGVINERPEVKDDRVKLSIVLSGVDEQVKSGIVLATIYQNKYKENPVSIFKYGDVVEIKGKIESLPHQRNPGEFDYGNYLKMHGIDAVVTSYGYDNITLAGHENAGFYYSHIINPVKDHCIAVIDSLVGGNEGEYLKGLVLGEKSNISPEMKENFVNAGVAHIIAVSGLNVAYVIIILWGLLIFIPIRYSYKVLITIFCLIFYMNLTGNTPSIIRAAIMASVFLLAQLIERKPNSYNIVAFAGLVILVIDPRQLFDAGFILSFTAILSIIIIYPILESWLENLNWYVSLSKGGSFKSALRQTIILFIGTLAAQIGTLPVTAIMFKKISIVSLLANLFAIPLSNIALAVGFIMILTSTFSMWLASVFAAFNSLLIWLQLWLITICAKWDYSYIETYFVDSMMFIFYYLVLVLILGIRKKNFAFRLTTVFLLAANFIVWSNLINRTSNAVITYLDTGSSGSTLIRLPGGSSVLINPGSSGQKYTSAERNIIPYLKSSGLSSLDLVIVNRMSVSEFRSLEYLCGHFSVKRIILPECYRYIIENKEISSTFDIQNFQFMSSSKIINQKGNFRLYIYYDSLFSLSTMLCEFKYGNTRFLFDDSEDLAENLINSSGIPFDDKINVLKTSGNGSFKRTPPELIIRSSPEYVVIQNRSKGRRSPAPEIFKSGISFLGINVVSVNEEGAAIFETDGMKILRKNWN